MPDWKKYVREHLASLQLGPERELEMVEEMAQHLEAAYEEALASGVSEREAYQRAAAHIKDWRLLECELIRSRRPLAGVWINRRFGSEARIESTTVRGGIGMGSIGQDLRYGARMLLKSKAFTAVAVLSLALGIGANTALFSLIDAVLLKTLPVKNPHALVLFNWLSGPRGMARSIDGSINTDPATGMRSSTSFSYLTFERFRDRNETLSGLFAFAPFEQLNVNVDGQAEIAGGQLVTGEYYDALGVQPFLGTMITTGDDNAGADPVVVITHRYWERRFGRDPEIIGKKINVNNVPFTIIGVTPPEFFGTLQVGESPDLTIPMALESQLRPKSQSLTQPWFWWVRIMGRLMPGVAAEHARANLEGLFQQSAQEGWTAAVAQLPPPRGQAQGQQPPDVPMLRATSGSQGLNELRSAYSQPLRILIIVVGAVLLIACANVANLQLPRAATREKEMAVRLAMGASRWRVIRQLLTESVLLALAGGALGVLLAYWGKDALLALRPWGGGELMLDLKLDLRVLGFTAAVSVITGILFGLAPALRVSRVDLTRALKDNARSLVGGSRSILTKSLIVAQVAMSLVLLIGAGLFVRTLSNLEAVDVGFNRENLLLFRVDPRLSGYSGPQIANLYQRVTERIEAVPSVRSATLSRHPLLSGHMRRSNISLQGASEQSSEAVYVNLVSASFFDTMEIPILLGRGLSPRDDERAPKVAVINQTMARKYFGDENPIGRRFGFGGLEEAGKIEIVGVARDAKYTSLRQETQPTAYTPYLQETPGQMNFAVRTSGDVASLVLAIHEAVREVDSNLPMFDVKTQSRQSHESVRQERLFATLSTVFAVLALLLACIGLYGVMSYAVARRTNEIGIRMALGATTLKVTRMVMIETMTVVLIGIVIGLGAALATTRLIASMLFGLAPGDPMTIAFAILVMIAVAGLSGFLPARRASRVDPMIALRYE